MTATGARVVAFEPNPDVQDALAAGLPPSAEIVRAAVSDTEGAAAFFLDRRPGLDGMASSLLQLDGMDGAPQVTVPTVTIDVFCAERRLHPEFIKIDAEGAEPMILAGARNTIARYRPVLVFEMWETHWQRYREVVNWLAADYHMIRLSDRAPVPAAYINSACFGVADILAVPRTALAKFASKIKRHLFNLSRQECEGEQISKLNHYPPSARTSLMCRRRAPVWLRAPTA